MKKTLLISFFFLALSLGIDVNVSQGQAPLSVSPKQADVVPGVLYIQLKAKHGIDFEHLSPTHTGSAELDMLFASIGVNDIYPFDPEAKNFGVSRRHGIDRMYVINFPEENGKPELLENELLKIDVIEKVSPRLIFKHFYDPNDPHLAEQYALDKMQVKDAWGLSKGSGNIVIADVDEGVNYNHEDFAGHIFNVEGHIGKDVVGTGTPGHLKPDFDPMPGTNQSHGMMTAGCFGMNPDNGKGGAGTGFNCKLMIVKIANDNDGKLYGSYEGLQYAVTHGANIVSCSWGGATTDPNAIAYFQTFIDEALDTGALVVVAAGNDTKDIDQKANFFDPANLKGVLTIGATTSTDAPANFSNFGHRVNAYAPGEGIFSTSTPENDAYTNAGAGTSASTPLVAGIAGLVWAKHTDWTPAFVMRQIIETCDNSVYPANRNKYWGRVNAFAAVNKTTVPGLKIMDFKVDGVDKGGLQYLNKTYSLEVVFKNVMYAGSGIQAKLLPIDGNTNQNGNGYTVQQTTAPLNTMAAGQQTSGFFKFTRDSTDQGAGTQIRLYFAISYGSATVQADKYYDTLAIDVDIIGDDFVIIKGVSDEYSNMLLLGNTYPNPVSTDGTISYELAGSGHIHLSICDVLGRTISTLSDGVFEKGNHIAHFDARSLEKGVYIYKLETAEGAVLTKRMIVVH